MDTKKGEPQIYADESGSHEDRRPERKKIAATDVAKAMSVKKERKERKKDRE
jgi:hypothetical protein